MKHYISVCAERGINCPVAGKVELEEAMNLLSTENLAVDDKENSILLFNGYKDTDEHYERKEIQLDRFSTIFLDVDNKQKNPRLLDEFKEVMVNYDYWLYETFSSTPERPKFRVIIPMDAELKWDKNAKTAIFRMFQKFADEKASWFFSPTLNKLETVTHHKTGREFPARLVKKYIDELANREQMEATAKVLQQLKNKLRKDNFKPNPEGWRNLPSVKKCLDGLHVGERDDSLCAACFAMDKNGYRSSIPQFLDECFVEREFKDKWRKRYSR